MLDEVDLMVDGMILCGGLTISAFANVTVSKEEEVRFDRDI